MRLTPKRPPKLRITSVPSALKFLRSNAFFSPPSSLVSNSFKDSRRSLRSKIPPLATPATRPKSKTLGASMSPPRVTVLLAMFSPSSMRRGKIPRGKSGCANSTRFPGALPTSRRLGLRGERCSASMTATAELPSPRQSNSPPSPKVTVSRAKTGAQTIANNPDARAKIREK